MKKYMKYMLFCILCILCIQCIQSYEYPTVIPYVNDFANVLSSAQINSLNMHCDKIERNTSYEIAIVALKTTDGQDRLEYANHIGENNGVGKKASGTGLVILWTEDNERGIAIATARGAGEIYVNDAKAAEIARAARHLMDEGKYYEGFEQMLTQIEQTIKERDKENKGKGNNLLSDTSLDFDNSLIYYVILFGAIGIVIWLILKRAGYVNSRSFGGSGISFGGSGFSGGSFGGASFGGGGGRG